MAVRYWHKSAMACLAAAGLAAFPALAAPGFAGHVAAHAADPTRLPGDHPPPPLAIMLRPHQPADDVPPVPIADPPPGPSLQQAEALAHAVLAACSTQGQAMGVVVVDSAGAIRVALSMPGTGPSGRVFTATQKALAALAFGMPSAQAQARLRAEPALRASVAPNIAVFPGGHPLFAQGRLIGAVAASGGTAAQDDACVGAGLTTWQAAG